MAITKYLISSQVETAGQQGRKPIDSLAGRIHRERRAIRIRRMNIDGVTRTVSWGDRCKDLVFALIGAQLDLGAPKGVEQHRQMPPSIQPALIAEALPIKMLVREIAPRCSRE